MSTDGMSMLRRLRLAFAFVLVLVVLVGGFGAGALVLATSRNYHQVNTVTPAVDANSSVKEAMLNAQTGLRGYGLTRERAFLAPYERGVSQVRIHLARLVELVDDAALKELVDRQQLAAQAWLTAFSDVDDLTTTSDFAADKALFDKFRGLNGQVADVLLSNRAQYRAHTRNLLVLAFSVLAALTVVCALTGAAAATRTVGALALPLRRLGAVLERLRDGETSARADLSGPVEIATVARAANALADESDRLRASQRESARLRRSGHEASRRIREELDRDSVLGAAAVVLGAMVAVDRVWIRLALPPHGAASEVPVDVQWARPGLDEMEGLAAVRSTGFSLTRGLWRDGEVLAIGDVVTGSRAGDPGRVLVETTGASALLLVPVGGNQDVLAAVVLACTDGPREFTPDETSAVQSVCADLGRALEHSSLFERQVELVDRLQELDRQKTDFLSTVSHELRTPLTSISGYTELLQDGDAGELTAPMARMLEVIGRNTVRLKVLIEDLLTLSRIESVAFRSSVDDVDVDVARLVVGVEQAVRPSVAEGVELHVGRVPAGVLVRGDELQLDRVLLNLLSNAAKFTPAPGRIEVEVTIEDNVGDDWVVIRVRDTGIGIPAAEQSQLFSRFFRASNAVDLAVPGTGLGLTIVRSMVEHHQGRLDVASTLGAGTTVTVRLPLLAGEQVEESQRLHPVARSLAD